MIIVAPISTSQDITLLIRSQATTYDLSITDEETKINTEFSGESGTYLDGFCTFAIEYGFKEGRFYYLEVKDHDSGVTLNRSKVYATEQSDFDIYSVIEGKFEERETTKKTFYVRK